jgi:hypothetical protein
VAMSRTQWLLRKMVDCMAAPIVSGRKRSDQAGRVSFRTGTVPAGAAAVSGERPQGAVSDWRGPQRSEDTGRERPLTREAAAQATGGAAGNDGGGKAAQRRSRMDAHTRAVGFAAVRSTVRIHYRRRSEMEAQRAHQIALSIPSMQPGSNAVGVSTRHFRVTGNCSRFETSPHLPSRVHRRGRATRGTSRLRRNQLSRSSCEIANHLHAQRQARRHFQGPGKDGSPQGRDDGPPAARFTTAVRCGGAHNGLSLNLPCKPITE